MRKWCRSAQVSISLDIERTACSIGVRTGLWPAAGMRSWARGVQRVHPGKECGVLDEPARVTIFFDPRVL